MEFEQCFSDTWAVPGWAKEKFEELARDHRMFVELLEVSNIVLNPGEVAYKVRGDFGGSMSLRAALLRAIFKCN